MRSSSKLSFHHASPLLYARIANPSLIERRSISLIISSGHSTATSPTSSVSPQLTSSTLQSAPKRSLNYQLRTFSGHSRIAIANSSTMSSGKTFFDFETVDKKGESFPLSNFKGKVVLAVNTASKCGFTPQFKGLEELYQSIQKKEPGAFTVVGFPCNQFGNQDPGSNDEIQSFCQVNYGVTFPVLGKIDVNGDNAAPVYTWMKAEQPGMLGLKRIKWNFEKFLISADGKVVGRWASTTKPESLQDTILKEIEKAKKEGVLTAEAGKKEEATA
ncbi:hypothetical protein DTO166G4_4016 [Paecilomyces variotii]|nr:hypothetical protein DTO166G4_4016 [Paecilomyces variotii]KAJ9234843.1 hypothetical protein DTO166G5_4928 [Paecilomyces variotii]KAJ9372617.1 hypothetical protein DTO282E5_2650 [Paecilomyces variotii]